MKKSTTSILLAACLGLTACGAAQPAETVATTTAETTQTVAADTTAAETSAQATETTTAAADQQLSGKVTVYMPSPSGLADKLAAAFTEKTGVEVDQFQGTTGEILARLEAEQANPVADVVILASWSDGLNMKADGQLESYTPAEADKINAGWIDVDDTLFGYSASAVGVIYNTTVVPELSADWSELSDAKYKDMIAIPDPEKSGALRISLPASLQVQRTAKRSCRAGQTMA